MVDLRKAEQASADMIKALPISYTFHNWQHTAEVVEVAMRIAQYERLDIKLIPLLKTAALFHDTGYILNYQNHEEHSVDLVREFLIPFELDQASIGTIEQCIEATKVPQKPANPLAEILCDADLAHFGHPCYQLYADRLRDEWESCLGKRFSDGQWRAENLKVLRGHRYNTRFGKRFLEPIKEANIKFLIQSK